MLKAIIVIPVVTLLLTFLLMIEKLIVNFFLKLFKWRLDYLYHTSFKYDFIIVALLVGVILLGSLPFRKLERPKKAIVVSLITGTIAFGFSFLFFFTFSYSTNWWISFLLMGPATFVIGFLFPWLYRVISREPLFNKYFY